MVSGPPAVIKTGPVILNHDVDLAAIDPRPTWADSKSIGRVNPDPVRLVVKAAGCWSGILNAKRVFSANTCRQHAAMGTRNLRRDLKPLAITPSHTDLLIKRCGISK